MSVIGEPGTVKEVTGSRDEGVGMDVKGSVNWVHITRDIPGNSS